MNRLWFAVIFLALATGLCSYEQKAVKTTFTSMNEIFDTIDEDMEKEDYDKIESECKKVSDIWDSNYPFLSATNDHGVLEETGVTIDSLQTLASEKSDDLPSALKEARRRLDDFYASGKPSWGNIF